jgi:sigma-B regulation protein RsbU (phosphoserine phosphatase)
MSNTEPKRNENTGSPKGTQERQRRGLGIASRLESVRLYCELLLCASALIVGIIDLTQGPDRLLLPAAIVFILALPGPFRRLVEAVREEVPSNEELSEAVTQFTFDMERAGEIQNAMLPAPDANPFPDQMTIVTRYYPQMPVGGDFYDYKRIDEGSMAVLLADVAGHGLRGAFVTGLIKGSFEHAGGDLLRPLDFSLWLNDQLCTLTPSNSFASLVYLTYNIHTRTVTYINAGHAPLPIILLPAGEVRPVSKRSNMVLGVIGMEEMHQEVFTMPQGGKILLATDGLTEARGPDKEGPSFGYKRLLETVSRNRDLQGVDIDRAIYNELNAFIRGEAPEDDIATLILQFD